MAAPAVYRTLLNKYYVDEFYDKLFTGRSEVGGVRLGAIGAGEALWKFDSERDRRRRERSWLVHALSLGFVSSWWDKWVIDWYLRQRPRVCRSHAFLAGSTGAVGPGAVVRARHGLRRCRIALVLRAPVGANGCGELRRNGFKCTTTFSRSYCSRRWWAPSCSCSFPASRRTQSAGWPTSSPCSASRSLCRWLAGSGR